MRARDCPRCCRPHGHSTRWPSSTTTSIFTASWSMDSRCTPPGNCPPSSRISGSIGFCWQSVILTGAGGEKFSISWSLWASTYKRVPEFEQLVTGRATVGDIQDIDISDLLGRDCVPPKPGLFDACIRDRVVMVTGAGGSIGSELCRQIVGLSPKRLDPVRDVRAGAVQHSAGAAH